MVTSGQAVRLQRGAYLLSTHGLDPADQALGRISAAHHLARAEHCFSHTSAALLHGLPLWRTSAKVEMYQPSSAGGQASPHLRRRAPMPSVQDRAKVAGLPATTLERTAWDCMTTLPPGEALVVADAALRAGVPRDVLAAFALRGGRGHARALTLLRHADDGAESPPESMCRYRLLRAGLPVPETQVEVRTRLGTYWGDLGWPRWRVLLEYDGRVKYEERPTEVVIREKRRQDALVEEGWGVLRVTKEDLVDTRALTSRVLRALPRSATAGIHMRRELAW
jgi:very-short-patch-repair endonuclease